MIKPSTQPTFAPRIFVLIPTHTTRHLQASLSSLAQQTLLPDAVVVTCDNDNQDIQALLTEIWPKVCATSKSNTPLHHVARPHQGIACLNQVRNNGIRALIHLHNAKSTDLVVILDGDTMLAPDALEKHAHIRNTHTSPTSTALLTIPYRIELTEAQTKPLDPNSILTQGVPLQTILTDDQRALLQTRHKRYVKNLWLKRTLPFLSKPHKPKLIGGHHAFTIDAALLVNGFDEDYRGYRFNDDDYCKRIHLARTTSNSRVQVAIAVKDVIAIHLWHPIRAPQKLEDAPGYQRWIRTDLPTFALHGISNPAPQPNPTITPIPPTPPTPPIT